MAKLPTTVQVPQSKQAPPMPTDPKVGVVDPTGEPHSGGNTFAGGSGGPLLSSYDFHFILG